MDKDECQRFWESNIPLDGRPGTVDEMGRVATFLASDDASYVTGLVCAQNARRTHMCGVASCCKVAWWAWVQKSCYPV